MQRSELEKLGLEKEAIDSIMALNGKDIEAHKAKIAAAEAERDGLKSQLDEAAKAIDGFKALDIEGVKKSADEWKAKAEQAEAARIKEVENVRFDHALESALKDFKAKDPSDLIPRLKRDALKLSEDGKTVIGLKEQIEPLQAAKDYLFESDVVTPKIVSGGGNKPIDNQDAVVIAARKAAGLQ